MNRMVGDPYKFDAWAYNAMAASPHVLNALRLAAGMSEVNAEQAGPIETVTAGWEALPEGQRHEIATSVLLPSYLSGSDAGAGVIDVGLLLSIIGIRRLPGAGGNGGAAEPADGRRART